MYQPEEHKTAWHGDERRIFIGPRAQKVLRPFLLRDPQSYCFCPAEANAERRRRLSAERTTPLSCGNRPGSNVRKVPKRSAGDRYTTDTYRRAIQRACDQAFPPPGNLAKPAEETKAAWQERLTKEQKAELRGWQKVHRWHPHQLRHSYATRVRKEFGLETAQILLGHTTADVTEIYAERDTERAVSVAAKTG